MTQVKSLCVAIYLTYAYARITGVVGLTTAVKIQEQGVYSVTIIAETLPSDPKTIRYTSSWAVRRNYPRTQYIS